MLGLALLAAILLFATGPAAAHTETAMGDHGMLGVDVDTSTDPCLGTVRLLDLEFQNGTVDMDIVLEGTAPDQTLDRRTFNATLEADGEGYAATLTDFEMAEGWEYYFVVEYDADAFHSTVSEVLTIDEGACGDPQDETCYGVGLGGIANSDGSITLTADGLDGEARLSRHSYGTAPEDVAVLTPDASSYIDEGTEVGVTYTYALILDHEVCDELQVTAIPVFPSAVAAVLASVLGIGAYAMARRRR